MAPHEQYDEASEWHLKLFGKSKLKQQKLRAIRELLGSTERLACLDIGGDNGVISHLLRKSGGAWKSADISPKAVASIGNLVGEDNVVLLDGHELPFDDNSLDCIVIIDYLEHIHEDRAFVAECHRVLREKGTLIANVPLVKPFAVIRGIQKLMGLTDELHGHVRPGYSQADMYQLLKDGFDITEANTYSGFFVQLVDTGVQFLNRLMGGGGNAAADGPSKGVMIDEKDFTRLMKAFRFYSLIYPLVQLAALVDRCMFWTRGHALIVRAKARPWKPRRTVEIADGRNIADASINTKIGTAAPF